MASGDLPVWQCVDWDPAGVPNTGAGTWQESMAMHGAHLGVVGVLLEGGWVPRHLIDGRHDLRVIIPCMTTTN